MAAWFVHGPMANVVCAASAGSLSEPTDRKIAACEKACDRGSARACVYWDALLNGSFRNDPRILQQAMLTEPPINAPRVADQAGEAAAACDEGDADACGALGDLYDDLKMWAGMLDQEPDTHLARAAFIRGCELGNAHSCTMVGRYDMWAPDKGTAWLMTGCQRGDGRGCDELGHRSERDDPEGAMRMFERSCGLGDWGGCESASLAYRDHDERQSAVMAGRACALGYDDACERAAAYPSDEPLPPDVASGIRNACLAGSQVACYWLGDRLRTGRGLPADPASGLALLARAAPVATSRGWGGHPAETCEPPPPFEY
jgi:TPR repeat protein